MLDSSNNLIDRGEYSGSGLDYAEAAVSGYVAFSTAYGEVKTDTDNLVGTTEAKKMVNEALRIVANDRHWDWKTDDDPYEVTTADGTAQYVLPIQVKQVLGAWSDYYAQLPIIASPQFNQLFMHNRVSGIPRKVYLAGQNVIMPDPLPDDTYTLYIKYQRLYNLTNDSDTFPCPHDFVDCITSMAKWMACARKGKSEMANHFKEVFTGQLHALRIAEISHDFFVPGDPAYKARGIN